MIPRTVHCFQPGRPSLLPCQAQIQLLHSSQARASGSSTPHSRFTFHSNHTLTTMAFFTDQDLPAAARRADHSTSASWNLLPSQRDQERPGQHRPDPANRHATDLAESNQVSRTRISYFPEFGTAVQQELPNRRRSDSNTSLQTTIVRRRRRSSED